MTNSFNSSPAYMFTSESVAEGHPDKLCDQISDAILDTILAKDPYARVACETAVTNGLIIVLGEITTDCYIEIPQIVRSVVREIGYTKPEYGFDFQSCGVLVSINPQSTDIAMGVDKSLEVKTTGGRDGRCIGRTRLGGRAECYDTGITNLDSVGVGTRSQITVVFDNQAASSDDILGDVNIPILVNLKLHIVAHTGG